MKLKTKEELYPDGHPVAYCSGIDDAFESFSERIVFFKRYKSNFSLLKKDVLSGKAPEDCPIDFFSYIGKKRWYDKDFNNWLFYYCFGDVK